ncbi:hypothetical protein [Methylobacterium oryzisoli]|uniref:hypothetical protein n=1 Tax=Methylobacterium oryzisoli TaxID=3385502 RepID=UPI0038918645
MSDADDATGALATTERLARMAELASLLAERVLSAHMENTVVPDAHMRALVDASLLLDEYGQQVPPLLAPIMDQLRARAATQTDREPAHDT